MTKKKTQYIRLCQNDNIQDNIKNIVLNFIIKNQNILQPEE